jgi:hypothetical protein
LKKLEKKMTTRKKREEMNTEELRAGLKTDCHNVLKLIGEMIEEGLDAAPASLLERGDAFVILAGAISAVEYKYLEHLAKTETGAASEAPKVSETNKKLYN